MRTESADLPIRAGSRVVSTSKGLFGRRMRCVARIVEHRPPHGVIFGQEARLVDEQAEGPFAYWQHEHEFEAVDAKTTRVVDRVKYGLRWGPIGWVLDWLVGRRKIRAILEYRHGLWRQAFGAGMDVGFWGGDLGQMAE